jgi:hypothetical protein
MPKQNIDKYLKTKIILGDRVNHKIWGDGVVVKISVDNSDVLFKVLVNSINGEILIERKASEFTLLQEVKNEND